MYPVETVGELEGPNDRRDTHNWDEDVSSATGQFTGLRLTDDIDRHIGDEGWRDPGREDVERIEGDCREDPV